MTKVSIVAERLLTAERLREVLRYDPVVRGGSMTSHQLPYLAMDNVLCDRPQDGCYIGGKRNYARDNISNTTKKETTKMKTLSADQLTRYVGIRIRNPAAADRYWARCAGMAQDSSMDDETVDRVKSFLKPKLSAEDHETVCSMMDGAGAEDTEPYRSDPDEKPRGKLAGDAKARNDFYARFPDVARIKIDTSGLPISRRPVSTSASAAKSFAEMFPDASRIKLA